MPGIRGMDDKLPDIAATSVDRLGLLDPELSRDVVFWYGSLRGIKSIFSNWRPGKCLTMNVLRF